MDDQNLDTVKTQ